MKKTYLTAEEMKTISKRDVRQERYQEHLEALVDKVFEDVRAAAVAGKRSHTKIYDLYPLDSSVSFEMIRDLRTRFCRLGYSVYLDYNDISNNICISW